MGETMTQTRTVLLPVAKADIAPAADRGKVRSLPATVGTYRGLAIAEEVGVEGGGDVGRVYL